ncbi:MAG: MipA/OmpV family protein [Geminicoccaceae bacterium]
MQQAQPKHPLTVLVAIALGSGLAVMSLASAEEAATDEDEAILNLTLGAGVGYEPDYEGSDDYEVSPFPFVELNAFGGLASLSIGGLRALLPLTDHAFVGAGVGYDFGRDEDDNDALEGLGDVDGSVFGQLVGGYALDPLSFALIVSGDIGDIGGKGHEGYTVDVQAGYEVELIEDKAGLSFGTGLTWASENYTEAFFGVSAAQAAASGLDQFDTEAGFKSAGVELGASYRLTDSVGLQLELGYSRLLGDAADSPIVADEGSPNQFSTSLVLTVGFDLL